MSGEGEGGGAEELWFMERRHILVLLYLYREGMAIKSELRSLLKGDSIYVERVIMDLEERGLVREKQAGRRTRIFTLTDKGREVAELLDKLARKMAGEASQ
ncbi:winged helix DNA-binding protein [Infirmifilum sp. SLHALR2]